MIENYTKQQLSEAIENPGQYGSGAERKKLQAIYDKFLDEVSRTYLCEPCESRMSLRQKVNGIENKTPLIKSLANMLKNDHLLFSKDYRDHSIDIEKFLVNHLSHFMEYVNDASY